MSVKTDYGVPRDQDELGALASILAQSFAAPAEDVLKRMEMFDEIPRVIRADGRVTGGIWLIPMAQWFGGRSVPMGGVAAVGVPPEGRGTGTALEMMVAGMAELREQGVPLSSLYPAAQTLYRKTGFEQAGGRYSLSLPGSALVMVQPSASCPLPWYSSSPLKKPILAAATRVPTRMAVSMPSRIFFRSIVGANQGTPRTMWGRSATNQWMISSAGTRKRFLL